jgi:hypothetical protein
MSRPTHAEQRLADAALVALLMLALVLTFVGA